MFLVWLLSKPEWLGMRVCLCLFSWLLFGLARYRVYSQLPGPCFVGVVCWDEPADKELSLGGWVVCLFVFGLVVLFVWWVVCELYSGCCIFVLCFFICFCFLCWCLVIKGVRWMPGHQELMKDVAACDMPRGVGERAFDPRISEWGNLARVVPGRQWLS